MDNQELFQEYVNTKKKYTELRLNQRGGDWWDPFAWSRKRRERQEKRKAIQRKEAEEQQRQIDEQKRQLESMMSLTPRKVEQQRETREDTAAREDAAIASNQDLVKLFKKIDTDNDGKITKRELLLALRRKLILPEQLAQPFLPEQLADLLRKVRQEGPTRAAFERVFASMDSDNKPGVDLKEFDAYFASPSADVPEAAQRQVGDDLDIVKREIREAQKASTQLAEARTQLAEARKQVTKAHTHVEISKALEAQEIARKRAEAAWNVHEELYKQITNRITKRQQEIDGLHPIIGKQLLELYDDTDSGPEVYDLIPNKKYAIRRSDDNWYVAHYIGATSTVEYPKMIYSFNIGNGEIKEGYEEYIKGKLKYLKYPRHYKYL